MAFNGLRLKYDLDGSSNYIAWKDHMEVVLEDNGLKDFIDKEVPKLATSNTQELCVICIVSLFGVDSPCFENKSFIHDVAVFDNDPNC